MIEVLDDTPIRDFLYSHKEFCLYALADDGAEERVNAVNKALHLVRSVLNIDEQVLGVDEDGHAILGIEREEIVAALLQEMKSGT